MNCVYYCTVIRDSTRIIHPTNLEHSYPILPIVPSEILPIVPSESPTSTQHRGGRAHHTTRPFPTLAGRRRRKVAGAAASRRPSVVLLGQALALAPRLRERLDDVPLWVRGVRANGRELSLRPMVIKLSHANLPQKRTLTANSQNRYRYLWLLCQ